MIDISKEFTPSAETVIGLLQKSGVAFYVPLYQRPYSWDKENIEQLTDDICSGVRDALGENNEIRFMGTLILITERTPKVNIDPRDVRALPNRIDNVIDGQQRISTISLLGTLLYERLAVLAEKLPQSEEFDDLRSELKDTRLARILELFSVDLQRGSPVRKPIIIRGSADEWTLDGDDSKYESEVASHLAKFLRAVEENTPFPAFDKATNAGKNLKQMKAVLTKIVERAHRPDTSYPSAKEILSGIEEELIWSYERPELREIASDPSRAGWETLCSVVQILGFLHYLTDRCCFTVIEPTREDWAFDMFQSLNASGTPLTAIETFKPLVVNMAGSSYKGSPMEKSFEDVDELFSREKSAPKKAKLTNEFLTVFALTESGKKKLPAHFSRQRKWLNDAYKPLKSTGQTGFIQRFGELSEYFREVVLYSSLDGSLERLKSANAQDAELGTLCMSFLQVSGHRMAHTILSLSYRRVLRGEDRAVDDFILTAKSVAAFFSIWRAARSTSGLDDVYRRFFEGDSSFATSGGLEFDVAEVRKRLRGELEKVGLLDREAWVRKASGVLSYRHSAKICRFFLFLAAHDSIIDSAKHGLMKAATEGTSPHLNLEKWNSKELSTVEHVAPATPANGHDWDPELYHDESCHLVGNLTLLPIKINSSATNKGWLEKLVYYRHLAETNPDNLESIHEMASHAGVEVAEATVKLLGDAKYAHHIRPIVEVGETGDWNLKLVKARSLRVCELSWRVLSEWL